MLINRLNRLKGLRTPLLRVVPFSSIYKSGVNDISLAEPIAYSMCVIPELRHYYTWVSKCNPRVDLTDKALVLCGSNEYDSDSYLLVSYNKSVISLSPIRDEVLSCIYTIINQRE